jgi:alkylation response protein AidB-like acyl-CoA dehydrogenase
MSWDAETESGAGDQLGAFGKEVRLFLEENLTSGWTGMGSVPSEDFDSFLESWREKLVVRGYLAPAWPVEYGGGGYSALEALELARQFALAGAPTGRANDEIGISLFGNTLLRWGTEDQKAYFLPRVISGEDRWCQGYSEPDAGSDLASLSCRAVLDGDLWRIDGQKIWTTSAMTANWIFLLVRTETSGPKHRGITFLLCPMNQPGVEVRPIKMLSGSAEFCEVYFTEAVTSSANRVGEVGEGWKVAMTLLSNERGSSAVYMPVIFRVELDRLVNLAREKGALVDPVIRQRIAVCYTRAEILRFLGLRTVDALSRGVELGPDASIFKLSWSEHHKEITELALSILGAEAMAPTGRRPVAAIRTDEPGAPSSSASWVGAFFNARAGTIYAGTSEIQRNIIGEMVLGLPKEAAVDKNSS